MEASSKYNKWCAWIKWNKYVTSILTKDEVLEMEKWHEITIDDPDYPIYASIKKYWKWYLIESIDNNLYIETWMILVEDLVNKEIDKNFNPILRDIFKEKVWYHT